MGWTYTTKPKSQSVQDFFKGLFDHETERTKGEILDCATVGWSEAYLAYNITHKQTGRVFVFGLVCLISYQPSDSIYNFGYKDMDETMGPVVTRCPERILRQLSALDQVERDTTCDSYKWAQCWRRDCWVRVKKAKALETAKAGDVIEFKTPIRFMNGVERSRFLVCSKKGHRVVLTEEGSTSPAYRISRESIISRDFAVLKAA